MLVASGDFNFYRYVSNNPTKYKDSLGYTQEDIDIAFAMVRAQYPEVAKIPYRIANPGELEPGKVARYLPGSKQIIVHEKYLEDLCGREKADLLDSAFHEAGHAMNLLKAAGDAAIFWAKDKDDPFHKEIYDQATIDTFNAIDVYLKKTKSR